MNDKTNNTDGTNTEFLGQAGGEEDAQRAPLHSGCT